MRKSRNKLIIVSFILLGFMFIAVGQDDDVDYGEKNINFIPNEETAIKLAEAVWLPIYGKEIEKKKPFKAKLINDSVWKVMSNTPYMHGDVYVIKLNKKTGHIYYVAHEK